MVGHLLQKKIEGLNSFLILPKADQRLTENELRRTGVVLALS